MRRFGIVVLAAVTLLGASKPVSAAMEVTLAVSPRASIVGQGVEVLMRTYLPISWNDLGMVPPSAYPLRPGLAYVLWPLPDYPFGVVARDDEGTELAVGMTLDPSDPTLWRGTFRPDHAGAWEVCVTNFEPDSRWTCATLDVAAASPWTSPGARRADPSPNGP